MKVSESKKSAPATKSWLKRNSALVLKISCLLFLVSYGLTYWSGSSNDSVGMGLAWMVLFAACLLPLLL